MLHAARFFRWPVLIAYSALGLFTWGVATTEAAAQYRVEAGDVIEVEVSGIPSYRYRVKVQLDGSVSLPVAGSIAIAGSSPGELRLKMVAALASRVVRQIGPDGLERPYSIEPGEISANVVEYRPIYVSGDVLRPGEQPFRPGITARQAISSAGGGGAPVRQMGLASDAAQREALELQASITSLWTNLAKEVARIWRLRTQLGGKERLDDTFFRDIALPRDVIADIISIEQSHLQLSNEDHEHAKSHLTRAMAQSDEHVEVLTAQAEREEKIVAADNEDLKRLTGLFADGNAALPRLADARRIVLLSSARFLQTRSQLIQVKKERADHARELQRIDDQRKIRLLQEVQDAKARAAGLRGSLKGHFDRIRYAQGSSLQSLSEPSLTVFRRMASGETRMPVTPAFALEPGDVVEVRNTDRDPSIALKGEGTDLARRTSE
jgi:polysaccharide export outer membrane protein